ncbi:hypothetical protein [Treponema endosymbiont of Eucomonympha sp.]|uniref:hypothetical protein n=1 Tax=Treponema endosymbiont of Eucomonympha sp. TaxID=1580831 RepID=UPI0007816D04|nr:hypothetical protein [Treponema endosymbiont of Eucomonympha sp.]
MRADRNSKGAGLSPDSPAFLCLSRLRRNHYAEFAADLRLAIEFVYANLGRRKARLNGIEAAFFVCASYPARTCR